MADSTLTIKDATGNLVPVDVRTTIDGDRRQVVLLGAGETAGLLSPATEDTLAAVLTALGSLSDDPATQTTLAAILTQLADPATQTTLAAVLAAVDGIEPALAPLATAAKQDTLHADVAGGASPTNLPGASGAVTSVDGRLMGFSVREAAGTPAKAAMRLRAGGAAGAILATVTLAPEESVRDWFGPNGITATGGVYYELVSGTISGGVSTR